MKERTGSVNPVLDYVLDLSIFIRDIPTKYWLGITAIFLFFNCFVSTVLSVVWRLLGLR